MSSYFQLYLSDYFLFEFERFPNLKDSIRLPWKHQNIEEYFKNMINSTNIW